MYRSLTETALVLFAFLLIGCGKEVSVEGKIALVTRANQPIQVERFEILVIGEDDLNRFVEQYHRELQEKLPPLQARFKDAELRAEAEKRKPNGLSPKSAEYLALRDAVIELEQRKYNSLWERVYSRKMTNTVNAGLNGFSGSSTGKNAQKPVEFTTLSADSSANFRLTIPRNKLWCFFVIGYSKDDSPQHFWFKKDKVSIRKTVELNKENHSEAGSESAKENLEFTRQFYFKNPLLYGENYEPRFFPDPKDFKEEFILRILIDEYGLGKMALVKQGVVSGLKSKPTKRP